MIGNRHAVVIVNEDNTAQVIAEPGVVVHLLDMSEATLEERCPLCGNDLETVSGNPYENTSCLSCEIDWQDIDDAMLKKAAAQAVRENSNIVEPVWK